ncbi:FKBP-type 22 kDa peptidyl-prolyl cis-trans isomerase [Planctomycetes bacterium CA13]|uniref:Peptidyl-prolyl cis-trans isomerase n=1 Tax=Novipirellula herctigrandis TaxID=2527986 RepID=A0A5C5YP91_9BACT|nr:FKBP-type 22 kDa peptidyl-prolyl cis-trans isomerase [Planctomycetes bacterium CA13]
MTKFLLFTLMFCLVSMVSPDNTSAEDEKPILKPGPADSQEKEAPGSIDEDASAEFKKTESGLKYRILRKSDKAKPKATDKVQVHYKGWLDNKTIFDSSYRRGQKIAFPLNRVIPGWTEGMQLVGEGGMIELEIPSKIGYGPRGAPPTIPGNATLHFIVELFEIQ